MAQRQAMSMREFHNRFPDEESCYKYLTEVRWPKRVICPNCGGEDVWFIKPRSLFECKECRRQTSVTAGTVFHKTRTPLYVWFWAIFLVSCDKRGHSALSLSNEMDVSYWVAWTMLQKIRKAMGQQDEKYRLKGLIELDEAYFGGEKKGGKRGRGTTNAKVLVAVSTGKDKKHAGFAKMKVVENFDKETVEEFAMDCFEPGCVVQTDGLNIYGSLSSFVKKHETYVIAEKNDPMPWVHTIISNAKSFILGTFHGAVETKHLQAYLDEYCYRFNRRFWESQLFNRLIAACADGEPTTFSELTQ
jgi:hypothetical protein